MEPADRIGTLLGGRYRIQAIIGLGAMGAVYRAEHEVLLRSFAVKVLRRDLADDQRIARRFQREARAASRMQHPNIVYISDFGTTDDGSLYLVMEFIPGHDLRQELRRRGVLEPERALRVLLQLAEALECAHQAGVVHRDLKPENLLLTEHRGRPDFLKVLDFGMAKIIDTSGAPGVKLTGRGEVFGTPEYMSPEQIEGGEVLGQSDIYTVGVLAYELVTGRPPFTGARVEVLISHCQQTPIAPSARRPQAGLLPGFDAIVGKCLAKRPEDRYASAADLKAALGRLIHFTTGEAAARLPMEDTGVPEGGPQGTEAPFSDGVTGAGAQAADPVQAAEVFQRAARELAEALRDFGLGSAELGMVLGEVLEAEEHIFAEQADIALCEFQVAEADHTADEREARLRLSLTQLTSERARLGTAPAPQVAVTLPIGDRALVPLGATSAANALEGQIAELVQRMADLERQRHGKVSEIEGRVSAHRRALDAWGRQLETRTLRLVELMQQTRPEVVNPEIIALYRRLDELRPLPDAGG